MNPDRAHILLQAPGGNGKTFISAIGGKPLYLAVEVKCRRVVQRLNHDAKIFPVESMDDFTRAIAIVQDPRLVEQGFTRIVTDSFTELTEYLPTWLNLGFPLQKQHYGQIQNKAMELMLALLKAPIPSVTLCRSVAKEFGDITKVVPGSLGKSAENLPAKCILTAESRHDDEKGWVLDTTPSPYTQRSGLPWVPQIFQGTMDEFLALVESDEPGTTPTPEPVKPTAPPAPEPSKPTTKPKAEPAKPTGPTSEQTFEQALIAYADALHKAGWPPAERKAMCDEWRAHGPAALAKLQQACSGVTPWQAPVVQDPAWVSLMARLAEQTVGRPDEERRKQVAAWEADHAAKPEDTKERLEDYVAALERLKAMGNAPDPELDPAGYKKAFSDVFATLEAEKRQRQNAQNREQTPAAQFANAVAAGPGTATAEDIQELLDLCRDHKIDLEAMWKYALEKGGARPDGGAKNWFTVQAEFLRRVVPLLKDNSKRTGVISWLHKKYQDIPF